jgi:hypothetical protein
MPELKFGFNLKKKLRANPTAKKNRSFKGSNQMRLKNIRNKINQNKLNKLTRSRQRMTIMNAMHSREGPLNSIRYQPELFENIYKHSNSIKQRERGKHRHKYSKKKGGVGKRKHSDPNDSDDPGEPDYKKMKIQAATQIQSSMRGRQSRQKSKKTKQNIGRRETIYTSHKKNFRDLNSNEKSEIRRIYREHIKSLGEEDELANYLHSKYFRGEEHYTSRPLPLEQIIQEENLHNLGLNLDDAITVELLLELAEINAQLARRDEMAVLENIDD